MPGRRGTVAMRMTRYGHVNTRDDMSYSTDDLLSDKTIEFPEIPEDSITGEPDETESLESQEADGQAADSENDSTPESKAELNPEGQTAEPEPQGEHWTKKAYLDEKGKRQEAQQKITDLEAQLAKLQNPSQQTDQPAKPDWFNDPEAAAGHMNQQFQQQLFEQKVEVGKMILKGQHDDFDQAEQEFFRLVNENPQLGAEIIRHPNPAQFVYDTGKNSLAFKEMQDVDSYKAKIEAEIRAKIEAEYEEKAKARQSKLGAISPSIANSKSAGGVTSDVYSGPPSLDEILQ